MTFRNGDAAERGQALTEMAVMGFLGLLALGFMLQLGLRQYYQLEAEQASFRRALQIAKAEDDDEESPLTSFTHISDRQLPNPVDPFGIMPRVRSEGRGTVTWGEALTYLEQGDRGSEPRIVLSLNNDASQFRSGDFDTGDEDAPLIRRIHNTLEVTEGRTTQRKADRPSLVTTQRDVETTWTTTATLKNGREISSTLTAGCTFRDRLLWRCDRD